MSAVQALQTTLAGEHAAVYVYGVIGGRLSASQQPDLTRLVTAAYAVHRGRRDQLTSMIRTLGTEPVAADPSYDLPTPCRTVAQLRSAALQTESRCAEVYAATVAATSRAHRQWAIDALTDAAVRELGFGGHPQAYPGLAEL